MSLDELLFLLGLKERDKANAVPMRENLGGTETIYGVTKQLPPGPVRYDPYLGQNIEFVHKR